MDTDDLVFDTLKYDIVRDEYSVSYHNRDGLLHRTDDPAIEYADGSKSWWINGEYHREDGPAIEYADGSKSWWINGKLHRGDGHAIESAGGHKEW